MLEFRCAESHIEAVSQELRDRGYRVQSQLGLSALRVDLAVRRKDSASWELAIMVDDVCWADRGSAFQREILPRQVLARPRLEESNANLATGMD